MPARPHDAEEPRPGEPSGGDPDEPEDVATGSDGAADPADDDTPAPDDGPGESSVPGRPDDIGPEDVDARWVQIVSQLGAPDPRSWAPDPAVEAAEEHFEPPDPEPVLGGDPLLTMAWSAVAGVPALVIVAVLAWRDIPTLVLQVAGVAFLAAVGLLFWRMPHDREDDAGPGAVV
jgi:hypothetical protein